MLGMVPIDVVPDWSTPAEKEQIPDEVGLAEDAAGLSRQQEALLKARRFIAQPYRSVITFDVFDTFLFRRCTNPDGVFERAFYHLPIAHKRPGLVETFVQTRRAAEARARNKKVEEQQPSEVTIEEIYQRFPRYSIGLDDVSIEEMVAAELRAEFDLCIVNPDMLELLKEAKARQEPMRVGFISDTYWSEQQLAQLINHCVNGLEFDFLHTSAGHRLTKASGLLIKVMQAENYSGTEGIHIGDNPIADILGGRTAGIPAVYYPQPHQSIPHLLAREALATQLMRSQRGDLSNRLDQGFHLVRRTALSKFPTLSDDQRDGAAIFGPVLAGYQQFVKQRLEQITASGGKAALLFLARDGHLPYQLWTETESIPAHYIEVNRRIGLIANLTNVKTLQDVFVSAQLVDEAGVRAVLKADLPAIRRYFKEKPDGVVEGKIFSRDLPSLLDGADTLYLADMMRDQLFEYLRAMVADFDDCTDLLLVDLGYYGTIQKSLRGAFTRSGMKHRLHGVYLATIDDCFVDVPEGDSVVGYIDNSVITPTLKGALLRNIAVVEQIFSAPQGSVRHYEEGVAQREAEIRPWQQLAFCAELQQSARLFAQMFYAAASELKVDLFSDLQAMRDCCSILMLRFLIFPTMTELQCYGSMKQDVNLGTYLLYDMANTDHYKKLQAARGFSNIFGGMAPPMWLGGSVAGMSGFASCAYGLRAFGMSVHPLIEDKVVATVPLKIIKNGVGKTSAANCLLTPSGEIRLRFAVLKRDSESTIALPLESFMPRGLIRTIVIQGGHSSDDAMSSNTIEQLKKEKVLSGLHCQLDDAQFTALNKDAHLLIEIPDMVQPVTIVTMTVLALPPIEISADMEDQVPSEGLRAIA